MMYVTPTRDHTAHIETPHCEEGIFYQFNPVEYIHIWLHGVHFSILPNIPVTDSIRKMLEDAARNRIADRMVAIADEGHVSYKYLKHLQAEEDFRERFPTLGREEKVTIEGVETALYAVSLDGTPLPPTEEMIRCAKEGWLCPGVLMWTCDAFPGAGKPGQMVIQYSYSKEIDPPEEGSLKNTRKINGRLRRDML